MLRSRHRADYAAGLDQGSGVPGSIWPTGLVAPAGCSRGRSWAAGPLGGAMNWDAVGAIAESVGAVGVVASLVYLALQVRQNTQQVRLSRFQEASSSLQDGFAPIYNPGNPAIWYKGQFKPDELDEQEAYIFRMFMERQLYNVQNIIYQHEHGLIDEAVFESTMSLMQKLLIDSPGGSSYWEEHRHMYTAAMRAAVVRMDCRETRHQSVPADHERVWRARFGFFDRDVAADES